MGKANKETGSLLEITVRTVETSSEDYVEAGSTFDRGIDSLYDGPEACPVSKRREGRDDQWGRVMMRPLQIMLARWERELGDVEGF